VAVARSRQACELSAKRFLSHGLHPDRGPSPWRPVSGKKAALARLGLIAAEFDFLRFDTNDLMIHKERAAAEILIHYSHRQTGVVLETKMANFWTFEEGWPVKLSEYHDIARIQAFAANVAALTTA
jgi:ketosteroid isomerase-like protein